MTTRHFLSLDGLSSEDLSKLLDSADELKAQRAGGRVQRDDLAGLSIGMLFEKPSTRTRISFEVAIAELGARPVLLDARQMQLGRGEPLEDTARILSGYLHALVIRTFEQSRLETLATVGSIPVVNALSDFVHPCQALADLQTIREYKGTLPGLRVAYLGDGNNVAHALLTAGALAGMHVSVGTPAGYEPIEQVVRSAREIAAGTGGSVTITTDPVEAARGADVVYTDVWASMGQESEHAARVLMFQPFQVNGRILEQARPDAIVMHCLPAHRGEEITADVIDGQQSVVWAQAENRLHSQKALLLDLLG
ncbi:MAG TPA: ornithine carbamoyltransferase [Egibacteraceae bacterium]|nr:ornithine carbamoyltransferase [Egibacteraceae bacterium]